MKSSKAKDRLSQKLGRQPTLAELAEELKTPLGDLLNAIRCTRNVGSIDAQSQIVEESTILDLLSDERAMTPDEMYDQIELNDRIDQLRNALDTMDATTKHVLISRTMTTRAQLSRETGLSHVQIKNMETKGAYRCRVLINSQKKKEASPGAEPYSFECLEGTPLGDIAGLV